MICRVLKYPLNLGETTVVLPGGSTVLHVDLHNRNLCLWALVPIGPKEGLGEMSRRFFVVGAGHDITYSAGSYWHVGTAQDGQLVWHVFELAPDNLHTVVGYTAGTRQA